MKKDEIKTTNEIKPTKDITPDIIKAMKEGYSQRKAINVAGLKNSNPKKDK
jgi:hypothetical protein